MSGALDDIFEIFYGRVSGLDLWDAHLVERAMGPAWVFEQKPTLVHHGFCSFLFVVFRF